MRAASLSPFLVSRLCPLVVLGLLMTSDAFAKTVVCVSQDGDRYTNIAEGYYRQLVAGQQGAVVQVGTTAAELRDCLSQVAANDTLYVAGHGWKSIFKWGATLYAGFSGGRAAVGTGAINRNTKAAYPTIPLPANFPGAGIVVTGTVTACYSASALQGGRSVVTTLQDGIAAASPAVSGFTGEAMMVAPTYRLTGGNVAERNAANTCLGTAAGVNTSAGIRLWLASFRPPTSGANPNAQTKADEAINNMNCPNANGKVSITIRYNTAPWDRALGAPAAAAPAKTTSWTAFSFMDMDAGSPSPSDPDAGMDMDAGMPPPPDMDAGTMPPPDMDAGMPPPPDMDAGTPDGSDYDDGGYYEPWPDPIEDVSAGCCEWYLDGQLDTDGSGYGFGY